MLSNVDELTDGAELSSDEAGDFETVDGPGSRPGSSSGSGSGSGLGRSSGRQPPPPPPPRDVSLPGASASAAAALQPSPFRQTSLDSTTVVPPYGKSENYELRQSLIGGRLEIPYRDPPLPNGAARPQTSAQVSPRSAQVSQGQLYASPRSSGQLQASPRSSGQLQTSQRPPSHASQRLPLSEQLRHLLVDGDEDTTDDWPAGEDNWSAHEDVRPPPELGGSAAEAEVFGHGPSGQRPGSGGAGHKHRSQRPLVSAAPAVPWSGQPPPPAEPSRQTGTEPPLRGAPGAEPSRQSGAEPPLRGAPANEPPYQTGAGTPLRGAPGAEPCCAELSRCCERMSGDGRQPVRRPGELAPVPIHSMYPGPGGETRPLAQSWSACLGGPASPYCWTREQVGQWLMALGLGHHVPTFMEQNVTGAQLFTLDSRQFRQLGIDGEDKVKVKRKLKALRLQIEQDRKQAEREKKERERLQKKAEKLAEKAVRRKL